MPFLLKPRHSVNGLNIPSSPFSSKGKIVFYIVQSSGISSQGGRGKEACQWGCVPHQPPPPSPNEPLSLETQSYKTRPLCFLLLPFLLLTTILRHSPPLCHVIWSPFNFNHFKSHCSKWPPQPLDCSGPSKVKEFGCSFFYPENKALLFPPLSSILIQCWFVVVVFLAMFTNSSRLSLRERCFLQVSHSAFMAQIMEIPLGYAGARLCASHFYVRLIKCIYFLTTKLSCFQPYQRWNTIALVIPYVPCLIPYFSVLLWEFFVPWWGTFSFLFSCSFLPSQPFYCCFSLFLFPSPVFT